MLGEDEENSRMEYAIKKRFDRALFTRDQATLVVTTYWCDPIVCWTVMLPDRFSKNAVFWQDDECRF